MEIITVSDFNGFWAIIEIKEYLNVQKWIEKFPFGAHT